jgi:hypothetical protein
MSNSQTGGESDGLAISRRRVLARIGAATGVAVLAPSLLDPVASLAQTPADLMGAEIRLGWTLSDPLVSTGQSEHRLPGDLPDVAAGIAKAGGADAPGPVDWAVE